MQFLKVRPLRLAILWLAFLSGYVRAASNERNAPPCTKWNRPMLSNGFFTVRKCRSCLISTIRLLMPDCLVIQAFTGASWHGRGRHLAHGPP